MSDFSAVLKNCDAWAELTEMISGGNAPHAIAAILPKAFFEPFKNEYARTLLCLQGLGTDRCKSCESWSEDGHPDLFVVGTWGDPPGVADCIALHGQLSLRPVVAGGRLGVVCCADSLSLPAANSLLKVTEEPPEGGHILYLSERDNMIPTIRSRVWTVHFSFSDETEPSAEPPPGKPSEWAGWFEASRKKTLEMLVLDVERWIRWYSDKEDWRTGASLKNLLEVAQKRHLPVSMVQDALYVLLWEGIYCEQIFGDLREA